jgi:hypothetical protein
VKTTYRIDASLNTIFNTFTGEITVDDVVDLASRILADPEFRIGMNTCGDFSNATLSWSLADLDRFRSFYKTIEPQIAKSKWAPVFPKGKDATTAKIFAALTNAVSRDHEVRVFRDRHAALAWLQEQVTTEKE